MSDLSMGLAWLRLGPLVRRAASRRERVTITDHGRPAAVIMNAEELADLEEALAIAEFRAEQASGRLVTVPHEQVKQMLGLEDQK